MRLVAPSCSSASVGRRFRGANKPESQLWYSDLIEALLNQSHTPTGLDGCDEARGAVVLFRKCRPAFQGREQAGEPTVVFRSDRSLAEPEPHPDRTRRMR